MNELEDLKEISKYAGERFDLVQAGGGNSSVKFDNGEMVIKASGYSLSEVNVNNGYSRVLREPIARIVKNTTIINEADKRRKESLTAELVKEATIDKANRPSIETLLHSFLYKYTLHTHPIVVNAIVNRPDWQMVLKSIFKNEEIAYVEYQTPGIEVALIMDVELSKFEEIPQIIFLQNHGLIITSTKKQDIFDKTEYVLEKVENYLKVDFNKYKRTNAITALLKSVQENENISFLTEDAVLHKHVATNKALFSKTPFCPDSLVYCGMKSVEIKDTSDEEPIKEYLVKYYELPKIVILENNLYIIAQSIKKAKEIEEVLKFNVLVLENSTDKINYLELDELAYLSNWEAEKFRQNL